MLSCPYSVKKRPFSKKHCALMYFFSFFYEKPPAFIPISRHKNVKSVISTLYYAKKLIGYPFFRFCTKKQQLICKYFVKKRRYILKKHTALIPIIRQQTSNLSKYMLYFFFNLFLENPLFSCPYLVQKNPSNLSKLHYIMGQKSQ